MNSSRLAANSFPFFKKVLRTQKINAASNQRRKAETIIPNLRDESAGQPDINTVSNIDYDNINKEPAKTPADDFEKEDDFDPHADRSFHEMDEE